MLSVEFLEKNGVVLTKQFGYLTGTQFPCLGGALPVGSAWAEILTITPKATPSNSQFRSNAWPPPNFRVPCGRDNAPELDLLEQR